MGSMSACAVTGNPSTYSYKREESGKPDRHGGIAAVSGGAGWLVLATVDAVRAVRRQVPVRNERRAEAYRATHQ